MNILDFPGRKPFVIPAEYLAANRELFARHGYQLESIRSEAELLRALEVISAEEWGSTAERLAQVLEDQGRLTAMLELPEGPGRPKGPE